MIQDYYLVMAVCYLFKDSLLKSAGSPEEARDRHLAECLRMFHGSLIYEYRVISPSFFSVLYGEFLREIVVQFTRAICYNRFIVHGYNERVWIEIYQWSPHTNSEPVYAVFDGRVESRLQVKEPPAISTGYREIIIFPSLNKNSGHS